MKEEREGGREQTKLKVATPITGTAKDGDS